MSEKISIKELNDFLNQPGDSEKEVEKLEKYFKIINEEEDSDTSNPKVHIPLVQEDSLSPKIELNTDAVEIQQNDTAPDETSIHEFFKKWRQKRYAKKIKLCNKNKDWNCIKIVSEGDSWFQYPLVRNDIIDQIFKPREEFKEDNPYTVFSLGHAGARLEDMYHEEEYIEALEKIQPSWFLLSGGGNDLLDGGNGVKEIIRMFPEEKERDIDDYINKDKLDERLDFVKGFYQKIFDKILSRNDFNDVKIICHGYDYIRPTRNGKILGIRLIEQNISNEKTMRLIMERIIDDFNEMLIALVKSQPDSKKRFFYADCRNSADIGDWNTNPIDDFHPSSEGFKKITEKFFDILKENTN